MAARFSGWPHLLSAVVAASCAGCADDDKYALAVPWAVNAIAPSAAVCQREGIDHVRLTIVDGARMRTIDSDCSRSIELSDGYRYGGFVTTKSLDYGVTYPYRVELLDAHGKAIVHDEGSVEARRGDVTPVELPTVQVFDPLGSDAIVKGSYSVGRGDAADLCARAGVNRVEMWVYSALDDVTSPDTEPVRALYGECASEKFDSGTPLLSLGDYQITYAALDYQSDGHYSVVKESDPIPVTVAKQGTVTLPKVDLALPER
jgi:hypothetical protein